MTATRVVCIGDVMVDVLARLPHALAIGSDTPAPISFLGGGSAANTAAWLVAAGAPATFVGRVGDDVLGRMALDELGKAGIDLAVTVDPERATGTCIVLVDASGERTMVPAPGANDALGLEPLSELITAETAVHVSGYTLFRDGSRAAAERAAALSRTAGASFSADAASSAPLTAFGVDRFFDWLAGAGPDSLLFANLDEALVLIDDLSVPADEVARPLAQRCGQAIVKCGRDGAFWSDGSTVLHAPAESLAHKTPLDSTGAGDAFAAGMLASRLRGEPMRAALEAGNALAARAISRAGARPPTTGT